MVATIDPSDKPQLFGPPMKRHCASVIETAAVEFIEQCAESLMGEQEVQFQDAGLLLQ